VQQSYRGPDRRPGAAPPAGSRRRLVTRAAAGAATGAACAVALDVAVLAERAHDPVQTAALAAVTWSAPLLVASALWLAAAKVDGRAAAARAGIAAAVAGGAGPGAAWLLSAVQPGAAGTVVPAALGAGAVVAVGHVRAALRGPAVQTDLRPLLAVVGGASLVVAVGAAAAAVAGTGWPGGVLPAGSTAAGRWLLAALGAAGGAALAAAAGSLRVALGRQQLRGLLAVAALRRHAADAAEERLRRHDARSALAAVRAASAVLTGPVAVPDADELAGAVRAELSRVERLLGGAQAPEHPGAVDLRSAVLPVVAAWRARGLDVRGPAAGAPAWGLGGDDAVRRVVGNLLDNAARHAAGAAVRLEVLPVVEGRVGLAVHDDGPGVPAAERDAVFAAGVRLHPHRPGEGLGLASALALAEADGGSLQLVDAERGARVELRLPAAQPPVDRSAPAPAPAVIPSPSRTALPEESAVQEDLQTALSLESAVRVGIGVARS